MTICRNIYYVHDDGTAELHCGNYCILLDGCDVDKASNYQWSIGRHGYATSGCGKNQVLLHRIIANAKKDETVDHVNRNKLDNRRINLRICSQQQNSMNKEKMSTGSNPYKGVCFLSDGRWQAQINYNGRAIYLGRFRHSCEAAKAYDYAARILFGEFAYLNFPECTEHSQIDITHHKKLSDNEVKSIRHLYESGMEISVLSKMYEYSYSAIFRIVHNITYKNI